MLRKPNQAEDKYCIIVETQVVEVRPRVEYHSNALDSFKHSFIF